MTLFNLGSENPLIRRARRHQSVSTLFRRASQPSLPRLDPADPVVSTGTGIETPAEVVQAEMVSIRGMETPEATTAATPMPSPPPSQDAGPTTITETPPRPSPEVQAAPKTPTAPPVPPFPQPAAQPAQDARVGVQAESPTQEPESVEITPAPDAEEEDSTITETVWQRLKTIFQRHQDSEREPTSDRTASTDVMQAEPEPGSTSGQGAIPPKILSPQEPEQPQEAVQTPAPSGSPPTPAPSSARSQSPALQRQAMQGREEAEATGEHRLAEGMSEAEPNSPRTPPPSIPAVREAAPAEEAQRQPGPTPTPEDPEREGSSVSPEIPPAGDRIERQADVPAYQGTELTEVIEPPEAETAQSGRDESPAPAEARRIQRQETHEAPSEGQTRRAEPSSPMVETPDASPAEPVRPPLQEVWDVQTTVQRPVQPTGPGRGTNREPPLEAIVTPQIQQVMREAEAGRPTRSSIEVIQPRRPRPPTPPPATIEHPQVKGEVGREVEPDADAQAPIQTATIPSQPRETEGTRAPEAKATRGESATPTQQMPSSSLSSGEDQPVMVETAIGPLPGDLWELIGEPVPPANGFGEAPQEARPARATTTETQRPQPERPAQPPEVEPAGRRPTRIEPVAGTLEPPSATLIAPPSPGPTRPPATTVQRAEADTGETPDAQPEAETESGGGMDVDELARRVYGEVRRRLAVELERMRSYF